MNREEIQNLAKLTDAELLNQTQSLVKEERRLGIQILHRLKEISRRRLYSELGFSSLFTYLCQHLSYPESTAYRLVNAMKLLAEIPEVEKKVETGELSISTLSQVQSYCQAQKKENALTVKTEEKRRILQAVEGCSRKKADQVLASFHSSQPLPVRRETERTVAVDQTEIKFILRDEVLAKLNRIKDLTAHRRLNPSYAELVDWMAELVLDQLDPIRKAAKVRRKSEDSEKRKELEKRQKDPRDGGKRDFTFSGNQVKQSDVESLKSEGVTECSKDRMPTSQQIPSDTPVEAVRSRTVPARLRQEVWVRAQGRCTYTSPKTGHRCTETSGLELEHCEPFGRGGSHELSNMTLLCKSHNIYTAIQSYGVDKMRKHIAT